MPVFYRDRLLDIADNGYLYALEERLEAMGREASLPVETW